MKKLMKKEIEVISGVVCKKVEVERKRNPMSQDRYEQRTKGTICHILDVEKATAFLKEKFFDHNKSC